MIYHRPITRVFFPFLPALALLPFLLVKPNRQFRAWIILIPFAVIAIIALAGQSLSQIQPLTLPAQALADSYLYVSVLAGSLCILCLILYALPGWPLLRKILLIPALYLLPGALILFFTQADGQLEEWMYPAGYSLVPVILLASGLLAGRFCRKNWKLWLFSLLFLAGNVLCTAIIIASILAFEYQSITSNAPRLLAVLMPVIAATVVVAVTLFIIAFPFILTLFRSPLYRERLMAAFHALPTQAPAPSVAPQPAP